ncbi:ROK family transcriptional regulator [Actinomadura sp. HBU206391]|uniref:ROK family transcriptional regulator n=1 Tax=Actinomadura sp. HBU206391 TaxID=2731692 RepID=UPI00164F6271|nr:ROK family transcriptional regulator [Actinomadura sp. HBU206391]MBC6461920.1 ROK family transcriptional regulator [Actinomadura sp. HBU206391]
MAQGPGTPRLLRALNDRAALELLLAEGPLTRTQIGARTGLSKVTASQLLSRLEERGLVEVVGQQASGRGPNAALYAVVPSSAYVAGVEVGPTGVTAGIADITGHIISQVTVDPNGAADPVAVVHNAVVKACRSAKVAVSRLNAFVIGSPGVVDPRTGDVQFAFDLPAWHEGVLEGLRTDLRRPVVIENDVNLVAVAERAYGAAVGADDFALVWVDRGIGLAVMLGGRLHRGMSGGAGEIGYLPVPGVPLPEGVTESMTWGTPTLAGGFGSLVGADAVLELAREHGFTEPSAIECVRSAAADEERGGAFLDELATRISYGVASVNIVLDPGLMVIAGDLGRAGGVPLAGRIEEAVARICPTRPQVTVSDVEGNPVLRGALHAALVQAREEVFSTTTEG